jgi:hypothetical protein
MTSSTPKTDHIPSLAEVDRIAALADPVIRNLQITQCYHELAVTMAARTGATANWCTFATWASKQAGQTIRKEDLARLLENAQQRGAIAVQSQPEVAAAMQAFGPDHSRAEIQESLAELLNPLAAINRASDAVGRGNKKVFEEIGREFARFLTMYLQDRAFDSEKIADFCAGLRPGEPPDGQQELRQAFARYYQAFFERDAKTRTELMLLANIQIGFHEQTRLQPEITAALDAAFVDRRQFRLRLIRALFPYWGWLDRVRQFLLWLFDRPGPFDAVLDTLLTEARRQAHLAITEFLLMIELPRGVRLRLGDDVPAEFPASLQHIALPDLRALLERLDPTPDSTRGTGAVDWSDLPDRLHFIIDMFRCYQESADLFEDPFTPEQVGILKQGRVPEGRL